MTISPHLAHDRTRTWRIAARLIGSSAVIAAGAWASGCSLLYDLSTAQCSTDVDCTSRGGAFADLVCLDNLCQDAPKECRTHNDCLSRLEHYGESACIQNVCVDLRTEECPILLPVTRDLARTSLETDPNTLILGGFAPYKVSENISDVVRNYDLALTEFTGHLGIPFGATSRQVVMVVCNSNPASPAALDASMSHLADSLKVPGIISALLADDLQRAFQKGQATKMFFMSPLESDPTLASLRDSGLLWHIGPGADFIARAYAPLLTRTLTHLALPPADTVRVASVVSSDTRFLTNLYGTIQSDPDEYGIAFNGKSVTDNAANYLALSMTSDANASAAEQVNDLLAFKPHVIIAATGVEFLKNVVPALEDGWDDTSGQAHPFYLLSPFVYNSSELTVLLTNYPAVRQRFAGVNGPAALDPSVYNTYVNAWKLAYTERKDVRGYENFYDAAYYLIYAAAARANSGLDSGDDLRRGMLSLLDGRESVDVGELGIARGLQALSLGNITLNGTLGPPDWDENTGTRQAEGSVWCVDGTTTSRSDVLRYSLAPGADPTTATLTGTFPCFPNF
jgi:hypothetical protein